MSSLADAKNLLQSFAKLQLKKIKSGLTFNLSKRGLKLIIRGHKIKQNKKFAAKVPHLCTMQVIQCKR